MKTRIYYHDTDCGGVVYYANYLKYMEEARTEYFQERGISLKELWEKGTGFVVARQETDYKAPAVYGDVLSVSTRFTQIGPVKLIAEHQLHNQAGQLICLNKTVLVCVDRQIHPKSVPEELKQKLAEERPAT